MNDADRISLRELITVQIDAVEQRFNDQILHMVDRLDRTERDLERRLAGMNEFREQLRQQANDFVMKDVYAADWAATNRRVADLEKTKNTREGQLALLGVLVVLMIQLYHWFK